MPPRVRDMLPRRDSQAMTKLLKTGRGRGVQMTCLASLCPVWIDKPGHCKPYAIRNECRSGGSVIQTINSLKHTKRMYRFKVLSERRPLKIWSPN